MLHNGSVSGQMLCINTFYHDCGQGHINLKCNITFTNVYEHRVKRHSMSTFPGNFRG